MIGQKNSVLVIGAGPSGMTAALALTRAGAPVTVIDKAAHTREHSQAALVWPRTLEIFDLLGMVDDWRAKSIPLSRFVLNVDHQVASLDLHPVESPHPHPWAVGQDVTEALMERRLLASGAILERQCEAISVEIRPECVRTRLRRSDGTEEWIESDWIIGCEGSHSVVSEAAGLKRTGAKNAGVQLVQGDVKVRGSLTLGDGLAYLFSDGSRRAMLVMPASVDGHYRVLATVPDDGAKEPPTLKELEGIARKFVPDMELYEPAWLNRYRTQHAICDRYRNGRALVAGDAAHVWVPVGGQGMNIGIQDAFDAGWKLGEVIKGRLPEHALDTYTTERRPIGAQNIEDTEKMYGALLDPQSWAAKVRRHLLPKALGLQAFDRLMTERFAETDFRYGQSVLIADHGSAEGPKAGERAPDAAVARNGEAIRLFDLYREHRWWAFYWAFPEHPVSSAGADMLTQLGVEPVLVDATREGVKGWSGLVLRDLGQIASRAFGVKRPAVHVIRPDAVIGFRGEANDKLSEYLNGIRGR